LVCAPEEPPGSRALAEGVTRVGAVPSGTLVLSSFGFTALSWRTFRSRRFAGILSWVLIGLLGLQALAAEQTIEQLKARFKEASVHDRPKLGMEIARREMGEADKLYAANNFDQAKAMVSDVVSYAELARDYAIQSHKYQKQSEIAVRGIIRRLDDLMHSLPHEEQPPLQDAIKRLQRVRDDLLAAMFPQGAK
jgi:hypothetical protein